MIPLALNPYRLKIGLAGAGPAALRRFQALRAAGAGESLTIFTSDQNLAEQIQQVEAKAALMPRLPSDAEIAGLNFLWIVGLDEAQYRPLAEAARAQRVLVNVEDVPEFCDFHSVAELRRGDLLLTISTNGQAPGLASAIRKYLETLFPESWASRVREIAQLRRGWRTEHVPMAEAAQRIDDLLMERCWLPGPKH